MSDRAHARNTDPITSHLAAASVDLSRGQMLVFEEFHAVLALRGYPRPMTDEELVGEMSRLSPSGARSRRAELTSMGLLVDTGGRVQGASGRWMIQWGLASWLWINGVPQFPIVNKGEQMALPLDEK